MTRTDRVTLHANLRTTVRPGSVDKFVKENISDKLGIDVPTQIIDNLKGRYTWMLGYEQPAHMQGHQHVVAAEVVDENAAKESLKTVVEKYPEFFEEKTFGNVTYYGMGPKELREMEVRPVDPFVAITDGYVFIGTSCQLFERSRHRPARLPQTASKTVARPWPTPTHIVAMP